MTASQGPGLTAVGQPFIDQLVLMGWQHTPGTTRRESFREVLFLDELKAAL